MFQNNPVKRDLKYWLDIFNALSEKLHEVTRNISYAGIGLIWIFKNTDDNSIKKSIDLLPEDLDFAALLIGLALFLDYLTYVWKIITIHINWRPKEKAYFRNQLTDEEASDIRMPSYISNVSWTLFYIKVASIIFAYILIINFLIVRI